MSSSLTLTESASRVDWSSMAVPLLSWPAAALTAVIRPSMGALMVAAARAPSASARACSAWAMATSSATIVASSADAVAVLSLRFAVVSDCLALSDYVAVRRLCRGRGAAGTQTESRAHPHPGLGTGTSGTC